MLADADTRYLGYVLHFLWTDLPTADNYVFLDYSTGIKLSVAGTYASGKFDDGAAEILTYDPDTRRLFVSNADIDSIDVLDVSDPENPSHQFTISLEEYGGGVNSVAVKDGILAAAVQAEYQTGSW